jgi:hypothetical protein
MNPVSAITGATCDRILDDPFVNHLPSVMGEAARIGADRCPIAQSGETATPSRASSELSRRPCARREAGKPVEPIPVTGGRSANRRRAHAGHRHPARISAAERACVDSIHRWTIASRIAELTNTLLSPYPLPAKPFLTLPSPRREDYVCSRGSHGQRGATSLSSAGRSDNTLLWRGGAPRRVRENYASRASRSAGTSSSRHSPRPTSESSTHRLASRTWSIMLPVMTTMPRHARPSLVSVDQQASASNRWPAHHFPRPPRQLRRW